MLVGTVKDCSSVGQAGNEHKQLVEDVIAELVAAVSAKEGISFTSGTIERLAAYTDVVADFPCGVKVSRPSHLLLILFPESTHQSPLGTLWREGV